jgi:ArsR family transcriptional regulator
VGTYRKGIPPGDGVAKRLFSEEQKHMVTTIDRAPRALEAASKTLGRQGTDTVADIAHLEDDIAKDMVQLFKLLADETRLRILYFLMQEPELNVRTLCEMLGQSQPAVSHHLALLRVAGLIESRRDGKHNFYRILPKRIQEMLGQIFEAAPEHRDSIRFQDYELTYAPIDGHGEE